MVIALQLSCAHNPHINPEGPFWKDDDTKAIPEPEYDEPSLIWLSFQRTTTDQLFELLDIDRNIRKISGKPTQAKNSNCYDEVPNSSWFTNRHGHPDTRLSPEEIKQGLQRTKGPDTSGVWKVFRPKVGGATPGFWIEDIHGDQYIIKFDPLFNAEMATAAAAIGSRYFYACGYNTPQETIVFWNPDKLEIKKGATIKGKNGKRPLTMTDIDSILSMVNHEPDGSIRSLASLNIGNVKGPFMYKGTKDDDPNDWCPHEHRRELRGLYVIGSLVNHYDLKDHNSMDVYVGEPGQGYLKHYLMDFGSILGSDGKGDKHPRKGYANMFDLRDILVTSFTLGLKSWAWQNSLGPRYSSIGYFESDIFEPNKFDPIIPNPAFEQMTYQDAYWGAKIVMSFTEEDLIALIDAGQYSNPEAKAYLLKTLKERQRKIGNYWFDKINPLDFPELSQSSETINIKFHDLAVEYGLEDDNAVYYYKLLNENNSIIHEATVSKTEIVLNVDQFDSGIRELQIFTERKGKDISKPVIFYLMKQYKNNVKIIGIEHPG